MPSLKELRGRINSVKSTKKITSAMKMVAASKLKRAQGAAEAARPYAEAMQRMLNALAKSLAGQPNASPLLAGTGRDQTHLLVVVSADRGLAGGFNSNVGRAARNHARKLRADGKTVKFLPIGRKGADYLEREFRGDLVHRELIGNKPTDYGQAASIGAKINDMLSKGEFDVCTLVFNRFNNVMSQTPITVQLIPLALDDAEDAADDADAPQYEFEPDEETILARLLPQNLSMQIYRAMLESAAGEQGARMTAMDSATRNAGKMIDRLTLNYNRTRQANITKELIEIISGAEAV
ncbi:F-type H+-transporting ATPase subunit gamma [Endobacter medicaginis]|uniref:ATP synthase gamma chain n=1 Tax=Endobacter medicaginis TaxID=1181271 RepID=A0A839V2L9_9PROT|nr:F0F1 ATP synthase subunit gamma [Endobacter medicaginis]MBB3174750.1 F-type H+-transporting ATPase subunit gamma [Endobacter medicaginis]MCX5475810.1 F0F1 ATP synthase subunit gamma [Endobacter medicaginis]NVN30279.1 F0F1 ATP synthase subunit gamma [Endobacter medicaginis]